MPISIKLYSVAETAKLTGLSHKRILMLFSEGVFAGAIKYNGEIWIPLSDMRSFIKAANVPELKMYSLSKRQGAIQRFAVLAEWEQLWGEYKSGDEHKRGAYIEAAHKCRTSAKTLFRWRSRFRQYGLPGLVDRRGGGTHRKSDIKRSTVKDG